jgi:hypothetical protein
VKTEKERVENTWGGECSEVLRHCPLVLLVKLGWKHGTALGNEEGVVLEVSCWDVQQREGEGSVMKKLLVRWEGFFGGKILK